MSTVELPLVPSARSSSSSASSNRSRLHSAGSINSEKSAQSVRRQRRQYQQEDEEDGEDEDGDGSSQSTETTQLDEEPQESSGGGLWDEVEHFLSKPSPSFSALPVKSSKMAATKLPKSTLPALKGKKAPGDNQTTWPTRPAAVSSSGRKPIDPKLLQEAFAYAHQLQQMDFDDDGADEEEQQQFRISSKAKPPLQRANTHSSSSSSLSRSAVSTAPQPSQFSGGEASGHDIRKKKTRSSASSIYSSATRPKPALRKKRSTCEANSTIPGSHSDSKRKSHMDPQILQTLVSNFQNGTSLEELRRELAASQQSMAMSRQVLQEAAQNFFHSH